MPFKNLLTAKKKSFYNHLLITHGKQYLKEEAQQMGNSCMYCFYADVWRHVGNILYG